MAKTRDLSLEFHSTHSVDLAAKMAAEAHGKVEDRVLYSRVLVEESKDLGNYIMQKRTAASQVSKPSSSNRLYRRLNKAS